MYCPNCGVNNDRGEKSCYICGSALPSINVAVEEPARGGKKRRAAAPAVGERPATVGDRALALIFDRILIGAALTAVIGIPEFNPRDTTGSAIVIGIVAGTLFLYHFLLEGTIGTTLGKAMLGLSVRGGSRGRFVGALLRNLVRPIDAIALYAVGFLTATFTRSSQRLGDLAGATVVMERRASPMFRGGMMGLWLVLVAIAGWMAWSSVIIRSS